MKRSTKTDSSKCQVLVLYRGVYDRDFEMKIESILAKEFDLEIDKAGPVWHERQYMGFRRVVK